MRFMIDSSGWLEYFTDDAKAGKFAAYIQAATPENCFAPSVVLYEVYKKIKTEHGEDKASKYVGHIKGCSTLIAVDENIALSAADLSIERKLPFADAIIKACADSVKAKLVTSDAHFKGLQNVEIV